MDRMLLCYLMQSIGSLNSEVSFSKTGCYIKVKGHSLSYYFTQTLREKKGFIPFPYARKQSKAQITSAMI